MLANKSDKFLKLKWDGRIAEIAPMQVFDLRDLFNITNEEVPALEARFMGKFPSLSLAGASGGTGQEPVPPQAPLQTAEDLSEAAGPGETSGSEGTGEQGQATGPVDPYKKLSLKDHTKKELQAMVSALQLPWTETQTKAELIAIIEKADDEEEVTEEA